MRYLYSLIVFIICFPVLIKAQEPAAQPSVLVASIPVKQGTLPNTITAYGTVEPMPDGATTISLLHAGQVAKLYVSSGQKVKRGDPLLDFGAEPAVLMAYQQTVSALATARKEQAHIKQLLAQQLATKSQMAQADKAMNDAEAALEAQKRQGSDKNKEVVTAPFDSVVTSIHVSSGDRVQASTPLMQLAHSRGLAVAVGVPLDDGVNVRMGDPVRLEPLDMDKATLEGNVASVASMLDPKTRLINILVAVPTQKDASLLPGEQYRASIEINHFSGVIVPRQAVLKDAEGDYIYQIHVNKAVRVNVHILGESGDSYAIDGEVDPKEEIVVSGNYELKNGDLIRADTANAGTAAAGSAQ